MRRTLAFLTLLTSLVPTGAVSPPPLPARAEPVREQPIATTETPPVAAKVRPEHYPLGAGSGARARRHAPATPSPVRKGGAAPVAATADPAAGQTGARLAAAHAAVAFAGMDRNDNPEPIDPPDSQVAAGPQHVVELMNVTGRVYTKAGATVETFDLAEFFLTPPGFSVTTPQVVFDPLSQRFFAVMVAERIAAPAAGLEMIAVSDTSDPTAGWLVYHTETPGLFPDSPSLGVGDDKVVVNANVFPTPTGAYVGAQTRVYEKADLLAGLPVTVSTFAPEPAHFSIQPAHSGADSAGVVWMAAVDFHGSGPAVETLKLFLVVGRPDADNVARIAATLPMPGVTSPPNAQQAGTGAALDTGDNRLLDAAYRNGTLWLASHTGCDFDGAPGLVEACLRVMSVDVSVNPPRLEMAATYGAPDAFYFYPAIAVDEQDNLYVVFGRSSAAEFAGLRHTGLQAGDAALQGSALLRAGEAPFTGHRWGSFFGAAPDPVAGRCVWVVGHYAKAGSGPHWGQYLAQLSFADACSATTELLEDFESGAAPGWSFSGENGGYAKVVREGSCFGANNTLGVAMPGQYALNVRSAPVARTTSVGIARSGAFTIGKALAFRGLSENDDAQPAPDPVTLEVRLLSEDGTVLLARRVKTNVVTLSPGTSNDGCLTGDLRNGAFSLHAIDTSAFAGRTGRVEFRQHTNVHGKGFFTLVDDVAVQR